MRLPPSSDTLILEICVDTLEGAWTAAECGAGRIELCAALDVGGLTPSAGMMSAASKLPVDVYAMIRPRAGDFYYSDAEKAVMLRDIQMAENAGLEGVVIGAVTERRELDRDFLATAIENTSLSVTLHRAIDTVKDYASAVETAIELGFERILSSGQATTADLGREALASAVKQAAGRISIMAGSGVSAANAQSLLAHAGVHELHASCGSYVDAPSPDALESKLGFVGETGVRSTDAKLVRALRDAMDKYLEAAA
ncbi:copper homeostasis protein CutC [uncultured Roseibium sp.]|uniref:copper homeostasis protein CutC n=1 Tax=uncultured Roseibium sp. TaxID=1936171 RepID=UPI002634D197|nr:copper homeostasis protein CutC [uncultured Roseibium sp.]